MSEEVNREQTKAAKQEKITELSDDQLDGAAGGSPQQVTPRLSDHERAKDQTDDMGRYTVKFPFDNQ